MTFDRVSKKKATECTPEAAKVVVKVIKMTDPITNKTIYTNTEGYDANADDDVHSCDDAKPSITNITVSSMGGRKYQIKVGATNGRYKLRDVVIQVDSQTIATLPAGSSYTTEYTSTGSGSGKRVTAIVTDEAYYTHSHSVPLD